MEDKSNIDNLLLHAKDYAEERIKLVNLNLHDKASRALSGVASALVFSVCGIFVLLFLSLALAWWIGKQLDEAFLGFLIVGGAYLLIAIVIYINREKWIRIPVINSFLKNVADEED